MDVDGRLFGCQDNETFTRNHCCRSSYWPLWPLAARPEAPTRKATPPREPATGTPPSSNIARLFRRIPRTSSTGSRYERANLSAAGIHIDAARLAEARGQLDQALMEFRRASEYDPANRAIAGKVLDLERKLRDQIEAESPAAVGAAAPSSRAGRAGSRLSSTSTASFSRFASSRPACATSSISSAKRLAST